MEQYDPAEPRKSAFRRADYSSGASPDAAMVESYPDFGGLRVPLRWRGKFFLVTERSWPYPTFHAFYYRWSWAVRPEGSYCLSRERRRTDCHGSPHRFENGTIFHHGHANKCRCL